MIQPLLPPAGFVHHVQPKVVSITQATELGTVYTVEETRALAEYAHAHGMYLHVDGARFANAAASLGAGLKKLSADAGVDIMTFGGTKNGLMFGEAVLVFADEITEKIEFIRKQFAQLASKMRFLSVQFTALLDGDLWIESARHANRMARLLAERVEGVPGVTLTQPVQANSVFALIPTTAIEPLQAQYFFYVWDEKRCEVRWSCSFDTTEDDVEEFAMLVRMVVGENRR
jgi:threonine aldolase